MLAPPVVWSPFLLLAGALAVPQEKKTWDPTFDYTNLQPSNAEYWEPLEKAAVSLEQALEVVAKAEGVPIRIMEAELRAGESPGWHLQIFTTADPDKPKRLNLLVSSAEPKVLRRLELLSIPADEQHIWESLRGAGLPPEVAIQLSVQKASNVKEATGEAAVKNARARAIEFRPEGKPVWHCQVMGLEHKKDKDEAIRRYEVQINGMEPKARRVLLLDRFSGEPPRSGEPTELENGMFLYDFEVGDGETVALDSKVRVNYRMFLLDGTKLYDTWKDKKEETFKVSGAPLKGMTEGMIGMRVGGRRKIAIPYPLAFGENGRPELAPPKAMVVCDVQIEGLVSE